MHRFANPTRLMRLSAAVLPWLGWLTALLLQSPPSVELFALPRRWVNWPDSSYVQQKRRKCIQRHNLFDITNFGQAKCRVSDSSGRAGWRFRLGPLDSTIGDTSEVPGRECPYFWLWPDKWLVALTKRGKLLLRVDRRRATESNLCDLSVK